MIRNSFIFLSGIGPHLERELWTSGVRSWEDYHATAVELLPGKVRRHREMHSRQLRLAADYLQRGMASPFARWLPSQETWRLFDAFGERALYLDIETTGLSYPDGYTTVVGTHRPHEGTRLLVRGDGLTRSNLQELLDDTTLLVTFNGKGFDVPFLEREFDVRTKHLPHLDLMQAFRKLGVRGGLKRIEADLGLARDASLHGIDGYEAVRLWKRWERGDGRALKTLLEYNQADVLNMVPLARIAYDRLHHAALATAGGSFGPLRQTGLHEPPG